MRIPDTIAPVHEPARQGAAYATPVDTSPVASGPGACGQRPYAPGGLVSLWDMLRVHAETFLALTKLLANITRLVEPLGERIAKQCKSLEAMASGIDGHVSASLKEETKALSAQLCNHILELLPGIAGHCKSLQLQSALSQIERIKIICESDNPFPHASIALKELENRIEDDLGARMFFFQPPERTKYLDNDKPFGEAVWGKLPEVNSDSVDACRCLAFDLPTGAVFYLMRVLEHSIRRLVKVMRVKATNKIKKGTWDTILKALNEQIESWTRSPRLGTKRRILRDRCAEAIAHLHNVRIAWRNPTMHTERTYKQEESVEIFENVRAFLNYLAANVF